jgi:hypothetical protein
MVPWRLTKALYQRKAPNKFIKKIPQNIIFLKGFLLNCAKKAISDIKPLGLKKKKIAHPYMLKNRIKISLDCRFKGTVLPDWICLKVARFSRPG